MLCVDIQSILPQQTMEYSSEQTPVRIKIELLHAHGVCSCPIGSIFSRQESDMVAAL